MSRVTRSEPGLPMLQPALHFVTYLKEYLMDHVEIFRKHTLHILQHKDVINDDVTRSRDW